ncbi:MAG: hypothetical protein WD895_02970 [Acidimicrobiia bacterium]
MKVFDGGFTSVIDLAFYKGRLYVAEFDEQGWAAVEIFQTGVGGLHKLRCSGPYMTPVRPNLGKPIRRS